MSETIINKFVGTTLVVSVSNAGRHPRVRIIENAESVIAEFKEMAPGLIFHPGWLCRAEDPRNDELLYQIGKSEA